MRAALTLACVIAMLYHCLVAAYPYKPSGVLDSSPTSLPLGQENSMNYGYDDATFTGNGKRLIEWTPVIAGTKWQPLQQTKANEGVDWCSQCFWVSEFDGDILLTEAEIQSGHYNTIGLKSTFVGSTSVGYGNNHQEGYGVGISGIGWWDAEYGHLFKDAFGLANHANIFGTVYNRIGADEAAKGGVPRIFGFTEGHMHRSVTTYNPGSGHHASDGGVTSAKSGEICSGGYTLANVRYDATNSPGFMHSSGVHSYLNRWVRSIPICAPKTGYKGSPYTTEFPDGCGGSTSKTGGIMGELLTSAYIGHYTMIKRRDDHKICRNFPFDGKEGKTQSRCIDGAEDVETGHLCGFEARAYQVLSPRRGITSGITSQELYGRVNIINEFHGTITDPTKWVDDTYNIARRRVVRIDSDTGSPYVSFSQEDILGNIHTGLFQSIAGPASNTYYSSKTWCGAVNTYEASSSTHGPFTGATRGGIAGAGGFGLCPAMNKTVCGGPDRGHCTPQGICRCNRPYVGAACQTKIECATPGEDALKCVDPKEHDVCMGNGKLDGTIVASYVDVAGNTLVPYCKCFADWSGSSAGESWEAYVGLFSSSTVEEGCVDPGTGISKQLVSTNDNMLWFQWTHQCLLYVGKESEAKRYMMESTTYGATDTHATPRSIYSKLIKAGLGTQTEFTGIPLVPAIVRYILGSDHSGCGVSGDTYYGGRRCQVCNPSCDVSLREVRPHDPIQHGHCVSNVTDPTEIDLDTNFDDTRCECPENWDTCNGCKNRVCPWDDAMRLTAVMGPCGYHDTDDDKRHGTCIQRDPDTCQPNADGYMSKCVCRDGWKGASCEVPACPLDSRGMPCGGIIGTVSDAAGPHAIACHDVTGTCECSDGWTGVDCSLPKCGTSDCSGVTYEVPDYPAQYYEVTSHTGLRVVTTCSRNVHNRQCECERSACHAYNTAYVGILPNTDDNAAAIAVKEDACSGSKFANGTLDWCDCYLRLSATVASVWNTAGASYLYAGHECSVSFSSACEKNNKTCDFRGQCQLKGGLDAAGNFAAWRDGTIPQCDCSATPTYGGAYCDINRCTQTEADCGGATGTCEKWCSGHFCHVSSDHTTDYRCKCAATAVNGARWTTPSILQPQLPRKGADATCSLDIGGCMNPATGNFICGAQKDNIDFCKFNSTHYECACDENYQGTWCEIPVNCIGLDNAKGRCRGPDGTYTCVKGYAGTNCMTDVCTTTGGYFNNTHDCVCPHGSEYYPTEVHVHNKVAASADPLTGFHGCRKLCPIYNNEECGSQIRFTLTSAADPHFRCNATVAFTSSVAISCDCSGYGHNPLDHTELIHWRDEPVTDACQPYCSGKGDEVPPLSSSFSCVCTNKCVQDGGYCDTPKCVEHDWCDEGTGLCTCGTTKTEWDLKPESPSFCTENKCDNQTSYSWQPGGSARCNCMEPAYQWGTHTQSCIFVCKHGGVQATGTHNCDCSGTMFTGDTCGDPLCDSSKGGVVNATGDGCTCLMAQWGGTYCNETQCGANGVASLTKNEKEPCACSADHAIGGLLCDIDLCATNGNGTWNGVSGTGSACTCDHGWLPSATTGYCTVNECCNDQTRCYGKPVACSGDCIIGRLHKCECIGLSTFDAGTKQCDEPTCSHKGHYDYSKGECVCDSAYTGATCAEKLCANKLNSAVVVNGSKHASCVCKLPWVDDGQGGCTANACGKYSAGVVDDTCVCKQGYIHAAGKAGCTVNCTYGHTDYEKSLAAGRCVCAPAFCGDHCEHGAEICQVIADSVHSHTLEYGLIGGLSALILVGIATAIIWSVLQKRAMGYGVKATKSEMASLVRPPALKTGVGSKMNRGKRLTVV